MYQVPMDDDFQLMLVSALRYALTRNSYIVGLTIEYIEWKMPLMDKKYLAIMSRDIGEEIKLSDRLSKDIDKRWMSKDMDKRWIQLKEKIDERLKEV
ncbi:hypothetical protein ACG98G_03175 [Megasphaera hexanoica]|uniref:Uncharacterized protein n=1 Tax=Megasphaera hexanoica TaxID=1675036 RepID=A0ABW7DNQ2_9FIRM|nr:hypothetical protein [Megasphaera hexanoica]AXB82317.1 hypothetical protein ACT01_08745 [Megasphaera hexanoica]